MVKGPKINQDVWTVPTTFQLLYMGHIIYDISIYNNKECFFSPSLWGKSPQVSTASALLRHCAGPRFRKADGLRMHRKTPENRGDFGKLNKNSEFFTYQKMTNKHDFPSNHHVLRSQRKKSEKKKKQSLEGCVHLTC